MANKPKKVEEWELRFEDPFYVYQLLLDKIVKKRKLDEEEKDFMKSVDAQIKSGELKILYPKDEGYDDLVISRFKLKYPSKHIELYRLNKLPVWATKFFQDLKKSNLEKEEYKSTQNITMDWVDVESVNGVAFMWSNEQDKLMFLLKYS